jgi:hypothetical protein
MRKITALALLITSTMFCQNKNFTVENGLINWKLVYEDSTRISELKNNPRLSFITDSTGTIKKTNFNDKNLRQMVADFKIESKKGKYRVSVFNMIFTMEDIIFNTGGIAMKTPDTYTIEYTFLKKDGTIRKSLAFGYNLTEVLDPHLTKLFTINKTIKSDW